MSRSRLATPLFRENSFATLPASLQQMTKQMNSSSRSNGFQKSVSQAKLKPGSTSHVASSTSSQQTKRVPGIIVLQKKNLSRQSEQHSRLTCQSTQGSYSQSSFNNSEAKKQVKVVDASLDQSNHLSSSLSQVQCKATRNVHNNAKTSSLNPTPSITIPKPNAKPNHSQFSSKLNLTEEYRGPLRVGKAGVIGIQMQGSESDSKKIKENRIVINIIQQSQPGDSNKLSFKDSFVDSDSFCNIDEKPKEEAIMTTGGRCPKSGRQKSLHDLIKERYIGPIIQNHCGNPSLLKRNILNTNSNLSASNASIKSSFIPLGKSSFQSNMDVTMQENLAEDSFDGVALKAHHCQQLQKYNLLPKTIFSELVAEIQSTQINDFQGEDKLQQKVIVANISELITSVKPSCHLPTKQKQDKSITPSGRSSASQSWQSRDQSPDNDEDLFKLKTDGTPTSDESGQEDIIEFLQSDSHKMHLIQTLQSLQYVKNNLQMPKLDAMKGKKVTLPPFKRKQHTKTVIFDLDETLVHCVEDIYNHKVDKLIQVKFPNGDSATAGINIRPYTMECLRRASELFQVVVFTASHQSYADVVLDILDPRHEIFELRLYRDSCVRSPDGVYVKDLRIFQHCRRMEDIVIVDNAVYSFGYQLENGIPIIPFYEDKEDEELIHLTQYLECLVKNGGDVREHNRKAFQLRELQDLDVQQFLSNMLYDKTSQQQQSSTQSKSVHNQKPSSNWEVLSNDQSVINEESYEEDQSSVIESRHTRILKMNELRQSQKQVDTQERVITNTSILERESNGF